MAGAIPILRPLRESLAGDRVTRVLGIVNGTTNFILDKMDTSGAGLRRGARGGPGAGLRRGRPDRRRRGLRRRRQGRDPGQPRLPLAGDRRRRPPRGDLRGDRRRRRSRPARWARVVKLLAIGELRRDADGDEAVSVRVHPAMIPRQPPAGLGPRGLQRGVRRVRGRRPADVLRPRRRRRAHRLRRARRPGHGRPQPARGPPRPRRVGVRRPAGAADGRDPHPLPRRDRRRRPRGRAGRGGDQPSPTTASRSRP